MYTSKDKNKKIKSKIYDMQDFRIITIVGKHNLIRFVDLNSPF